VHKLSRHVVLPRSSTWGERGVEERRLGGWRLALAWETPRLPRIRILPCRINWCSRLQGVRAYCASRGKMGDSSDAWMLERFSPTSPDVLSGPKHQPPTTHVAPYLHGTRNIPYLCLHPDLFVEEYIVLGGSTIRCALIARRKSHSLHPNSRNVLWLKEERKRMQYKG
jgi:hypothetical protein